MTVIAWDGRTLAADKRCSIGSYISSTTKIRRIGDALVGCSGTAAKCAEFRAWFEAGANPSTFPKWDGAADYFVGIVIRPGPIVERYEVAGYPILVEDESHAIGSGRDYAAMAMHLGKTARDAVLLAARFDENCGNGVDVLRLDERG